MAKKHSPKFMRWTDDMIKEQTRKNNKNVNFIRVLLRHIMQLTNMGGKMMYVLT